MGQVDLSPSHGDARRPASGRPAGGPRVDATESTQAAPQDAIALRLRDVRKTFPGVRALRGVDLDVRRGTVHALLGPNGSGKSTIVKILAGIYAPDPGYEASLDGDELKLGDAADARRKGLRVVHQDLGIVMELPAADNVGFVVGFARDRLGRIDWARQQKITEVLLAKFAIHVDPNAPMSEFSPEERAAVAIVRASASWEAGRGVVVLDEPTASLEARRADQVFRLIREIRDSGTAVVFVSHRLDEVMAVADRVTVLREGLVVWDGPTVDITARKLVNLIAGIDDHDDEHETDHESQELARILATGEADEEARVVGEVALRTVALTGRTVTNVEVSVHRREIVGVAGVLGSGREEFPYLIAGALEPVSGTVEIEGQTLEPHTVRRASEQGVAFVPGDRAVEGIITGFSTRENVTVAALGELRQGTTVRPDRERAFAKHWLQEVHADPAFARRQIDTLSGGNQQKAVIARWLATAPRVFVLSEPTAGVDVGARMTIYSELRRRADEGMAIVMASSDIDDLLAVCDRVLVFRNGSIVSDLTRAELSRTKVLRAMEGVHDDNR